MLRDSPVVLLNNSNAQTLLPSSLSPGALQPHVTGIGAYQVSRIQRGVHARHLCLQRHCRIPECQTRLIAEVGVRELDGMSRPRAYRLPSHRAVTLPYSVVVMSTTQRSDHRGQFQKVQHSELKVEWTRIADSRADYGMR